MKIKLVYIFVLGVLLFGCGPSDSLKEEAYEAGRNSIWDYETNYRKLESVVQGNPIGPNGDYWLVKSTPLGSDPVALVFGFQDNYAFCRELAAAQNQLYPGASVTCEQVTKKNWSYR